jgi:hypothetical protein
MQTKFKRSTVAVPESFQLEAQSQQRSMSNLGQIVILDYLQRRSTSQSNPKGNKTSGTPAESA